MTIEHSFDWLFKQFKGTNVKPCQHDLECLKFLAEWVNREKTKALYENILFAKLFCRVFHQEVDYYSCDFVQAQKKMHEYLKHPIEFYYDKFTEDLNFSEMNLFRKQIGLSDKHPRLRTDEEEKSEKDINYNNQDKMLKLISGAHSREDVYDRLNNTITEFINRYKFEGDD